MENMHIHVVAATTPWERRVALTPDAVTRLVGAGHRISLDAAAGQAGGYPDPTYTQAGAEIGRTSRPDLVVAVEPPRPETIDEATGLLALLDPLGSPDGIPPLAATGSTLLAFELIPRTTRAQAVDVLSSQSSLAGYQAALEAAALCDRIFPMLTTAAGTIRPSRVLVLGAGVAGLQAIATTRRLGAQVYGFDVRAAAAEQVESLGASFVTVDVEPQDAAAAGGYAQQLEKDAETRLLEGLHEHVIAADAVITTAAIPGRPAPLLVTTQMLAEMRPGSVVVDGAAATGGNCEASRPGETLEVEGVTVAAPLDLPSRKANHASQLFARNVVNFVELITADDTTLALDVDDDIVQAATVARDGAIVHDRVKAAIEEGG